MLLRVLALCTLVLLALHAPTCAAPTQSMQSRSQVWGSGVRTRAIWRSLNLPNVASKATQFATLTRQELSEGATADGAKEETSSDTTGEQDKTDSLGEGKTTENGDEKAGGADTTSGDSSSTAPSTQDGDEKKDENTGASDSTGDSSDHDNTADGSDSTSEDTSKSGDETVEQKDGGEKDKEEITSEGDSSSGSGSGESDGKKTDETEGKAEEEKTEETKDGNQTESDSKGPTTVEAGSGSNETDAYLNFILNVIVDGTDESESFSTEEIFANGAFVGKFAGSPNNSDISSITAETDMSSWYNEGAHSDRTALQIVTLPDDKDYKIRTPKIDFNSDGGMKPVLTSTYDAAEGVGSLIIMYNCVKGGQEKNVISLHIQITENYALDTTWVKTCGSGHNDLIQLGYIRNDDKVTPFNADGSIGEDEAHALEVGPLQQSTDLSAKLIPPQWRLLFETPYVESDNPLVQVALRGTIHRGEITSDYPKKFSILYYQCEQTTAKANIKFTFAIPPWDNVTATWRKDCGGSHSQALLIGTNGAGSYDVMQDGELDARYNVTEETSSDEALGKRIQEVAENKFSTRFDLSNSDDTSDIHIQTIAITMSSPDVVSAFVQVPFGGSSSYIPSGGGTIGRKETKSLQLHFICKKRGASVVLVTLPIVKYKNVEFGFVKLCAEPKAQHHSGFLRTAGSIMGAMLFLAVVGGIGTWIYMRRRAHIKYSPVSTNDRGP